MAHFCVYFVALCHSNVTVSIRLYAGKPEYPSGTRPRMQFMGSDNPNGAENQQETHLGILRDYMLESGCARCTNKSQIAWL